MPEGDERPQPQITLPPLHEAWLPREHTLYRPRHSKQQRGALVSAAVFFCVPALLFILGVRAPAAENREPARFPSLSHGWGFFTGLDEWATDQLPLRDVGIQAGRAISRVIFGEAPPFGQTGEQNKGPIAPPPRIPEETTKLGPDEVIEGNDGWLYLGFDITGACEPYRSNAAVTNALLKLRSAVESSGRQFVLVVAPNKTTMVPEFLPDTHRGRKCALRAQQRFWDGTVPRVGAIDLRADLEAAAARQARPVYPAVDTHWMHEGALAMTRRIAETIEPGISSSWRVTAGRVKRVDADLPPLLGEYAEYDLQTYDVAPDGANVLTSEPTKLFRHEPLHLARPLGAGIVSKKVGMIADSYTESAVRYLGAAFADLRIVHVETFGKDIRKAVAEIADSDVVAIEVSERFLVGGNSPLLSSVAVQHMKRELAKYPR